MRSIKILMVYSVLGIYSLIVLPAWAQNTSCYNFVVAKDGSGNFTAVQAAFNAVPNNSASRTVIYIKNGTYQEPLTLASNKQNVTIIGQSQAGVTLTYNNDSQKINPATGAAYGTSGSSSTYINASGFYALNVTFQNSSTIAHDPALAIYISGDKAVFNNCRFSGPDDTIYNDRCRQYFLNCYIEGNTDFIFGPATAVFDTCELHSHGGTALTAASTENYVTYGYVFLGCKITADTGNNTDLGRPWRPYASVAYLNCNLGGYIHAVGWDDWGDTTNDATARFSEYNNSSTITPARPAWVTMLSASQAANYTTLNVLKTTYATTPVVDNWNPTQVINSTVVSCGPTPTYTRTFTATSTRTSTATPTRTSTNTATPTRTASATATKTATATPTPTRGNTATNSPTRTATNSPTRTASATPTRTATATSTNTLGNTLTATRTTTNSPTATPSRTPTSSATKTPSATPSSSPTTTPSATATRTATSTPTTSPTKTPSTTPTATPTKTAVNTLTPTNTGTPQPTDTWSNTPSRTPTVTPTNSLTRTPTATATNTLPALTNTATTSPTNSTTPTPSSTATRTPTQTPTSTGTPPPTDTPTPTPSFTATATSSPTASPTNSPTPRGTNSATRTPTHSPTNTASATPSRTASSSPTATATNSPTPTFSNTKTASPSSTATNTATQTPTLTFTNTPTWTSTFTATSTASATWTFTKTATATVPPSGNSKPILYPNPATGPTVSLLPPPYAGSSDVKVRIFTAAFRKVQETTYPNVPSGTAVVLNLTDKWGTSLASGLYYTVVTTSSGRSIGKLLITR